MHNGSIVKDNASLSIPDYSVLAQIYDSAVALPVFPLLCGAFEHAVKQHQVCYQSLADLGCGTGNFVRYIARKGVITVGVDHSQAMLDIARNKKKILPIQFYMQDLRQFKLPDPVDLMTCQFDTLNYFLKHEELNNVFENCYQSLKPNGYFLFDLITGSGAPAINQKRKIRYGPWLSFWNVQTYPDRHLSRVSVTVKNDQDPGKHISEIHLQRWYPVETISSLLAQSGFSVVEVFDLERLKPADTDSYWVQFLVKKQLC